MGSAPGLSGDWGRQAVQVIRCGVFVKQLLLSTLDALARIFLLRGARVTVLPAGQNLSALSTRLAIARSNSSTSSRP